MMSQSCVVSEGNKHIHSVQRPVIGKAGVMDSLTAGNKLLTPSPRSSCLALCVQPRRDRAGVTFCYYCVFFLITPSPFSLSVKSCSRWGDRAQHAATGGPGNLRPPSKNMFWPSVPHLGGYLLLKPFFSAATWHNTLDRFYLHTLQKQNIFCTNETKNKRSYVAIVSRILLREAAWHCWKTRVELSLVIQFKNKRLLYGSYKCATTDTLKSVLATTLHNGYYGITL